MEQTGTGEVMFAGFTEEAAIRCAKAGNTAAMEWLWIRHKKVFRALAFKYLLPFEDFEDGMQEGFFALCKAVDTFDFERGNTFFTWLYTQVNARLMENNRHRTGRNGVKTAVSFPYSLNNVLLEGDGINPDLCYLEALPDDTPFPEIEEWGPLEAWFQSLPPRYQRAVYLYAHKEMTYRQVADAMNISESRAYQILQGAREKSEAFNPEWNAERNRRLGVSGHKKRAA